MTRMEGRLGRLEGVVEGRAASLKEKTEAWKKRLGSIVWAWPTEMLSAAERAGMAEGERVLEDYHIQPNDRRGPYMDTFLYLQPRERVGRGDDDFARVWDWEGKEVGRVGTGRKFLVTEECMVAYGYVMRNGAPPAR